MSKEFEYDPESGSFRFDEGGKTPKKKDGGDIGSWIIIAALFAFGLWPIGLIALISKLSDKPKKASAPRSGMRTSTSPNANVTARSTNKVEKTVVKTAKKMNRAPKASDKTARILMIVGAAITAIFGISLVTMLGEVIAYGWYSYMMEELFPMCGFFAGGVAMLVAGQRMKRRSARVARYLAVMGKRSHIAVDELCAVTGKSRKKVESDLDFMVEKGLLGAGAYLDSGRGMFFRNANAFADYANETAKKANVTPKEANEGYAGALRAIRILRLSQARSSARWSSTRKSSSRPRLSSTTICPPRSSCSTATPSLKRRASREKIFPARRSASKRRWTPSSRALTSSSTTFTAARRWILTATFA